MGVETEHPTIVLGLTRSVGRNSSETGRDRQLTSAKTLNMRRCFLVDFVGSSCLLAIDLQTLLMKVKQLFNYKERYKK